jgi:hypothetical protein
MTALVRAVLDSALKSWGHGRTILINRAGIIASHMGHKKMQSLTSR